MDERDLCTSKEVMAKLNISRFKLNSYIKAGMLLPIKVSRGNSFDIVEVERVAMSLATTSDSASKEIKALKKDGTKKASMRNTLIDIQAYLGGSTSNCDWTGTSVVDDIQGKVKSMEWGTYPKYHSEDYLRGDGLFCDTIVIAVPVKIEVCVKFGKLIPLVENSGVAQAMATKIVMPREKVRFGSVGLHATVIFPKDIDINDPSHLARGLKVSPLTKLNDTVWSQGEHLGYQLYRFNANEVPKKEMAMLIDRNREVIQGNYGALGKVLDLPIFISRLDITTNLPGAVKPYARDLQAAGLGLKDNKNYVGNTCHTYYPQEIEEPKSPYCIGLEDKIAGDAYSEQLAILQDIESLEHLATSKMLVLLEVCNIELSHSTFAIESKVYDKLRYMLQVGEVGKSFTGFNLPNLSHSPRLEIRSMFQDFTDTGCNRVETRYRLNSMLLSWDRLVDLHVHYCRLLSTANAVEYPFQKSLDAFLSTVKACTLLQIRNTSCNEEDHFLCSQWLDRQTCKINGLEKGLDEARATNWASYMSNRTVPLHVIVYKRLDEVDNSGTGILELERIATYPPLIASKGLAMANEVLGVFSTSKKVRHTFTLKLPFQLSPVNPEYNRLHSQPVISYTLADANKAASKMRSMYGQRVKRAQSTAHTDRVSHEVYLGKAIAKKQSINILRNPVLEGYIINHNNRTYFTTMLRHGRGVRYYKLHGSVVLPEDRSLRYTLYTTKQLTGMLHLFVKV